MLTLKKLLSDLSCPVLSDGAMGTYYEELTGKSAQLCELANINEPEIIEKIHRNYILEGARIIRTNTFSATLTTTGGDEEKLTDIIRNGYNIAVRAAGDNAVVCADVGTIYDLFGDNNDPLYQYELIIDSFLSEGAHTFIFETLSGVDAVLPAIDLIKQKKNDAEIILSFTLLPDGCTRTGQSYKSLLTHIEKHKNKLTAIGVNCGSGPAQLFNTAVPFLTYIRQNTDLFTFLMPNSGYPFVMNRKTCFGGDPEYFARSMSRFFSCGINVFGGCCGTDPGYIRSLGKALKNVKYSELSAQNTGTVTFESNTNPETNIRKSSSPFDKDFVIAVELDPPGNSDFGKLLSAANILKEVGVDLITVSDSPLGHAKADPVICSARIKRETGVETLPHICCRDRNINAVRSLLLGAHSEGIRNVLAVTGDHIPESDRGVVKPVFNMDSTSLMSLIGGLNKSVFADDIITYGGAFDPSAYNPQFALKRLDKKISCGAKFVLTQPVFSDKAIECIKLAKEKPIKILAGIMPMVSLRNALYMQNEVPGMMIPDELVKRFRQDMTKEEATRVGIEIACEIAVRVRPYADGFYFITPFNRAEVVANVIKKL